MPTLLFGWPFAGLVLALVATVLVREAREGGPWP